MKNKGFIQKVRDFFKRIVGKNKLLTEGKEVIDDDTTVISNEPIEKMNMFDEAKEKKYYMDLLERYIKGEVKENDMTSDEVSHLEELINEKIEILKRNNDSLKNRILRKLLNDKSLMQTFNKFKNKEITSKELSREQLIQINFLCDVKEGKI